MKRLTTLLAALFCTFAYGQPAQNFKSVRIGLQTWMTENLNVNTFRNGDPIPEAKTTAEWLDAAFDEKPAWCYYNNDPANGKKYGKLYNWYAVKDPRGLAPDGFHIPSDKEWEIIEKNYGAGIAGSRMKSGTGWPGAGGSSDFNGLPGGKRSSANFSDEGKASAWWSTTASKPREVWTRTLKNGEDKLTPVSVLYEYGASVRCINSMETAKSMFAEGKKTYEAGNYDAAVPLLEQTASLDPTNTEYIYILAKLYAFTNQLDKGISYASEWIRKFPKAANLYDVRYDLYMTKGDYRGATADIEQAFEVSKPNVATYMKKLLKHYCIYLNDFKATLSKAEEMWKLVKFEDNTNVSFIHYYKALAYYNLGDKAKAFEFMENSVNTDKYNQNPDALYYFALMLNEQKKYQEAKKMVTPILNASKNNPVILADIGRIYIDAGDKQNGCPILQQALKLKPDDALTKYINQACNTN